MQSLRTEVTGILPYHVITKSDVIEIMIQRVIPSKIGLAPTWRRA